MIHSLSFHFSSFFFSGACGSCIGYVDGHYVGFQHLYSEAYPAVRMNVDLLGSRRLSSCLFYGGAYEHFKGRAYCRTASVWRWWARAW